MPASGVRFISQSLFRAQLRLPANVPLGRHVARAYLFRQGLLVAQTQATLELALERAQRCLELDEKDEFPAEMVATMMGEELGLHLVFLPEEHGGLGGGAYDVYRVSRALADADILLMIEIAVRREGLP